MRVLTPKKSIADLTTNAIVLTDDLAKIKGGTHSIVIEDPIP